MLLLLLLQRLLLLRVLEIVVADNNNNNNDDDNEDDLCIVLVANTDAIAIANANAIATILKYVIGTKKWRRSMFGFPWLKSVGKIACIISSSRGTLTSADLTLSKMEKNN